MKVFHVDKNFLNTGGLSAPADRIYLPLYTHRPLCASRLKTLKHTDTNEHKHSTTANPLVHIRYTIFSSFLLRFSKWMIKSTMWSLIQVLRNARLLPTAGRTAGTKQRYWRRAELTSSSRFIKIFVHQDESQINRADPV